MESLFVKASLYPQANECCEKIDADGTIRKRCATASEAQAFADTLLSK